jgi:hypothetical protein
MNTFSSMKNKLLQQIHLMEEHKEDFVKHPCHDFIRKSKLSFENTIMAVISMECSSISSELKKFFGYSDDTPTSSAFVQQRDKLKPDAFEYLFHAFTSEMSSDRYKGFKLYAIDGSDVLIPLEKENKTYSYFTNENQGCYHQIHLNAIYNLMSNQYEDAYIEPRRGHNERNAFHQMFEEHTYDDNSVFIFDRGYESYPLMAHISGKNQFFLIRVKDRCVGGILKGIPCPDEDEFDFLFERTFVNKIKSEHAHNIDAYHRVHPTFTPYFLNENVKEYHMAFRVVRVRLSNGNYECLLTNLPAETFDIQALKELYRMRWGIETSFRHLKYSIGLLSFHSKKLEAIEMEIWAKLLLYNYSMAVANQVSVRNCKSKYTYRVNITNAIRICCKFLKLCEIGLCKSADYLISRELLPIRPDRSSPRKLTIKQPHKFNYRPQ